MKNYKILLPLGLFFIIGSIIWASNPPKDDIFPFVVPAAFIFLGFIALLVWFLELFKNPNK